MADKEYWAGSSEEEEEKPAQKKTTPKAEPKLEVKRAKDETSTEKKAEDSSEGIKQVFPKVGEKIRDFDRRSGDLKITEVQLPAMKDWVAGQPYDLKVRVIMKDSRYTQDSEYREGVGEIATSEPYLEGQFEIVNIEESSEESETETT